MNTKTSGAVCLLTALTAMVSSAQTFKTLVVFNAANGGSPAYMSLYKGSDGNLYGTTDAGGDSALGTVFKLTLRGKLTTMHAFEGGSDGANLLGGVIQASDGNYYGMTSEDGDNGWGTVFRMTPHGVVKTLHSFDNFNDGGEAMGTLVQGTDGDLYGTNLLGPNGQGTIFKITPSGTLTTLHVFQTTDGGEPFAGLTLGTDGNFYGTTSSGGHGNNGTVFKMTPRGKITTLHAFKSTGTDGASPYGGLVLGTDGNFYGTTFMGGAANLGTIFRIAPDGTFKKLYDFTGVGADGSYPTDTLIQASDGNFYGTTYGGGLSSLGTIFQMAPNGSVEILHSFSGGDGSGPYGGLTQASDGNLYGTTNSGGINTVGTVFRLSLSLP